MMISVSRSCSWTRPIPLSASCPLLCSWCCLRTTPRPLQQRRVQSRSPEPRHHPRQLPRSSLLLSDPVINCMSVITFITPLPLAFKAKFTCFATFFFTGDRERSRSPSDIMLDVSRTHRECDTRSCDVSCIDVMVAMVTGVSPGQGSQPAIRCYLS